MSGLVRWRVNITFWSLDGVMVALVSNLCKAELSQGCHMV